MASKDGGNICVCYMLISGFSAYGILYLFGMTFGSPNYLGFFIPLFIVFLVIYIALTVYIYRGKKSKKATPQKSFSLEDELLSQAKKYYPFLTEEEKESFNQIYGSYSRNLEAQIKKEDEKLKDQLNRLRDLEEKVNTDLNNISTLLIENNLLGAKNSLDNCKRIITNNSFEHLKPKIDTLQLHYNLVYRKYKKENSVLIKKKILELGKDKDRLLITEIAKNANLNDEQYIIEVIKEMINNQEIYAEYFESSKSILFDIQEKGLKIDKLLDSYKDWEDTRYEKKDSK